MNTGRIRKWISALALAGLSVPAFAQTLTALESTHSRAAEANTAAKHAAVAKEYRLHAEALKAKATEHEKNVQAYVRAMPQMQKWPGMAPQAMQREKSKAVEARRAANEAMALADLHIRLAVEAQATAGATAAAGD
jgi:hypothetical protein